MIWLVGTGIMGIEYAKVLNALNVEYVAIGRSEQSALRFEEQTGHKVVRGGLANYLLTGPDKPESAIVAVGIESLKEICINLLYYGVKKILQEKPGIGWVCEIDQLVETASREKATVVLAYNRRFYSSVLKAEEIIKEDGGVSSFNFEFTEWSHVIAPSYNNIQVVYHNWFLGNSSHVIDTAFYLGGKPKQLCAFHSGETELKWHPSGAIYVGAGISEKNALFSYQANWIAPGRWVVEILTKKHRLYFKPMESLQIQNLGSVAILPLEINNKLDVDFKPGLYLQTKAFLEDDYSRFCTIEEQKQNLENYYLKMSNYKK